MDLSKQAAKRILWQYRHGTNYEAWIDTLPAIAQTELEKPLQTIADILDIDNQSGELLDIVGRIAGVDRPIVPSGSTISGPLLPDNYFRAIIKAKISRNNSDATVDGIKKSFAFIAGTDVLRVDDNQNMTFQIVFFDPIPADVKTIIKLYNPTPKPQGVRLVSITESVSGEYFGYGNALGIKPYGVAPYALYTRLI